MTMHVGPVHGLYGLVQHINIITQEYPPCLPANFVLFLQLNVEGRTTCFTALLILIIFFIMCLL